MKARVSFSLCLPPFPLASLPCLHAPAGDPGSLPSPAPSLAGSRCWAGMKAGTGCWDGRLSEGRRRRGRRGGRGGGSANYTEQLWGLLKSRMKQRAAEASAAVGAEEPKHRREPEPAVNPAASPWARRQEEAGGPGDAGLNSALLHAGLEGSGVSPAMVPGG